MLVAKKAASFFGATEILRKLLLLLQLLGDMLLDRSNSGVMTRYVSSRDNLRILMNLLRV